MHGGVLPEHVEYGLDRINRWGGVKCVRECAVGAIQVLKGSDCRLTYTPAAYTCFPCKGAVMNACSTRIVVRPKEVQHRLGFAAGRRRYVLGQQCLLPEPAHVVSLRCLSGRHSHGWWKVLPQSLPTSFAVPVRLCGHAITRRRTRDAATATSCATCCR